MYYIFKEKHNEKKISSNNYFFYDKFINYCK